MVRLLITIKKRLDNARIKRAIRKANDYFNRSGIKFYVLWYKGKPLVKSKSELKKLIADGYFQKGFTIHHIEQLALYKTR
jgi:hypothetical protein